MLRCMGEHVTTMGQLYFLLFLRALRKCGVSLLSCNNDLVRERLDLDDCRGCLLSWRVSRCRTRPGRQIVAKNRQSGTKRTKNAARSVRRPLHTTLRVLANSASQRVFAVEHPRSTSQFRKPPLRMLLAGCFFLLPRIAHGLPPHPLFHPSPLRSPYAHSTTSSFVLPIRYSGF